MKVNETTMKINENAIKTMEINENAIQTMKSQRTNFENQ